MSRTPKWNSSGQVTAADVARAAGVSQSTVSRAFSTAPGPQPRKKAHILEVARQLGYHPNAFARALAANRSGIIALIASGLDDTFLSALLCGLVEGLQRRGLQLLVFSLDAPEQLPDITEKLHQYLIDGMIFTSAYLEAAAVETFSRLGKPIIMLNRFFPADLVRAVCCDNAAGTAAVADHLAALGRRRIALLSGSPHSYTAYSRAQGFCQRMEALGLPLAASVQVSGVRGLYEAGRQAMEEMLSSSEIDGVFCTNDMLAMGAMDAIRASGGANSIAVAGFDGHPSSAWPAYDLTTVVQPLDILIHASVETLCQMLEGRDDTPPCQLFPGELAVRSSTLEGVSPRGL